MKLQWPLKFGRKKNVLTNTGLGVRRVQARYDAAQTTTDNSNHWAMTDSLSADQGANLAVRKKIRERARYEVANNSYAKGMVLTLANDTIGTGPRLQLLLDGQDDLNTRVEEAWSIWSESIGLAAKLRTMKMSKTTDGESFAVMHNNPMNNSPVTLDITLIEADRVTSSFRKLDIIGDPRRIDGIQFDDFGNPISFDVANIHPGSTGIMAPKQFIEIPASAMIHYFRSDRPSQHRGVSEIVSSLPLYAQLRRYTLAVLAAAETAADFAAVIYTDAPADGEVENADPFEVVELEKRMATTLPSGWKLGQIKAEQPTTTYAEFKKEILNEIARCLNMPFNVAAGNSSGYNFASGRLDHQTYFKSISVEQKFLVRTVLNRLFDAWIHELSLLTEFSSLRNNKFIKRDWFFDGMQPVDPKKEAEAQKIKLESRTTTYAAEAAKEGRDWQQQKLQQAKENQFDKDHSLVPTETENATA